MLMTHDEMIAVIQAHKEGKPIQCKLKNSINWELTTQPVWNFRAYDFRLAPTPKWRPFTLEEYIKNFHRVIDRRNSENDLHKGVWRPVACNEYAVFTGECWITYEELLRRGHCFTDTGERCGVLES